MNIKDLFRRHRPAPPDSALRQIYLELYALQRNRSLLEIRVDGVDDVFQSLILHVDPQRQTLLTDEFFPGGFVGLPGQTLAVSARADAGRKIQFVTEIVSLAWDNGVPGYELKMPARLDSEQRRAAFRLAFADHSALPASISSADRACDAAIRDISIRGLRLTVNGEDGRWLRENEQCETRFEFAGMQLQCALDVRNIREDDERHKRTIGGEFVGLSKTETRELERAITRAQRHRMRASAAI